MNIWSWVADTFSPPHWHEWTLWKLVPIKVVGLSAAFGGEEQVVQRRTCIHCGLTQQHALYIYDDEEHQDCSGDGVEKEAEHAV